LDTGGQTSKVFFSGFSEGVIKKALAAPGITFTFFDQTCLHQGFIGQSSEALIINTRAARNAQNTTVFPQLMVRIQVKEGGQEFVAHEIAGGSQDYEEVWLNVFSTHKR
jgi:hypothetical protein